MLIDRKACPGVEKGGILAAMTWRLPITRILLLLWLSVGGQIHLVVDHGQHDSDVMACDSVELKTDVVVSATLCCYATPAHTQHDHHAPHAHLGEALQAPSAQRPLQLTQVAILPIRLMEALQESAPAHPEIQTASAPIVPYLRLATLRGPPVA